NDDDPPRLLDDFEVEADLPQLRITLRQGRVILGQSAFLHQPRQIAELKRENPAVPDRALLDQTGRLLLAGFFRKSAYPAIRPVGPDRLLRHDVPVLLG